MTKAKSKILLSVVLILILITSYCYAVIEPRTADEPQTTSQEGDVAPISEEEGVTAISENQNNSWTNSDLYMIGSKDKVEISNVVDGNAFIIAKEVTITGEIGGDLFVLADKVTIEGGYIYSSIFACANELTINGVVYDLYAVCKNFNLESNGFIYRDIKINAATVNMSGKVRRDAYINANELTFMQDAEAIVYGDLHYSSKSEIDIPEGVVSGEVTYTKSNTETKESAFDIVFSYIVDLIKTLLFTFIVTIILLWLTPKFIERVEKMNVAKSFISLGIGFVTPIALVIVSFMLLFIAVGTQLLTFGIFAFIVLAYIGFSITSIFFSKLLTKKLKMEGVVKFVLITIAIAAILWLICQIPVMGGVLSFVISIFGIGTTLVNMVWRNEESKKEIVKE